MSETRSYPRPGHETFGQSSEIQTRIACRGKSAPEALERIRHALGEAEARDADPLIVLEDLGQLRDSVATLIKAISRLLVGYRRTVTFWESSGSTAAFLSVMAGPHTDR